MRKIIICALALLSGCSFVNDLGSRTPEITMDHLEPITICAEEIKFNYDGAESKLSDSVKMWHDNVIVLDKSCANNAEFNIIDISSKKFKQDGQIQHEEILSAELIVTRISGNKSRALANVYNILNFDEDATLARKEKHLFNLNEKMIQDFDEIMRKSIEVYIK